MVHVNLVYLGKFQIQLNENNSIKRTYGKSTTHYNIIETFILYISVVEADQLTDLADFPDSAHLAGSVDLVDFTKQDELVSLETTYTNSTSLLTWCLEWISFAIIYTHVIR